MGHPNPDLKLAFLGVEESKETILELIEGYNSSLPAEGKVHHICFKVDSLKEEIKRLKKHGVTFFTRRRNRNITGWNTLHILCGSRWGMD